MSKDTKNKFVIAQYTITVSVNHNQFSIIIATSPVDSNMLEIYLFSAFL